MTECLLITVQSAQTQCKRRPRSERRRSWAILPVIFSRKGENNYAKCDTNENIIENWATKATTDLGLVFKSQISNLYHAVLLCLFRWDITAQMTNVMCWGPQRDATSQHCSANRQKGRRGPTVGQRQLGTTAACRSVLISGKVLVTHTCARADSISESPNSKGDSERSLELFSSRSGRLPPHGKRYFAGGAVIELDRESWCEMSKQAQLNMKFNSMI